MDIRVLGPVEVRAGGAPLRVERPLWRALLGILALRAGQVLSTDRLVDALWDTSPPADASAALQSHIARLRRALEPDRAPRAPARVLRTAPGGYTLDVDPACVDAHRFAVHVETGQAFAGGGDASAALAELEAALALWRGRPLAELGDTAFAQAERARLESLHVTAGTVRLECLLAVGRDDAAAAEAAALIREHPLHEPLWGILMAARYRLGRQGEALDAYARLRGVLAEELGIDPSSELRALEHAVLVQDPHLDSAWPLRPDAHAAEVGRRVPRVAPLPDALAVSAPFGFVARTDERARLAVAWKAVTAGEHRIVLVAGEPGAGKTRLVAEGAHAVHRDGGLVLAGRCDERMDVPYQPFVEMFRRSVDQDDPAELAKALGPLARELSRLYPPFAEQAGLEAPPQVDPESDRYRLFEAVAAWLDHITREDPALVVVDDIQWATTPTLLMFDHVARATQLPLLLVGVYRDTASERSQRWREILGDVRTYPGCDHLRLAGLGADDVLSLFEDAVPGPLDARLEALARVVHTHTVGNPFFVQELLRHLLDTGRIHEQNGSWTTDLHRSAELGLPESVRDVVTRRLARLSEPTNEVLRMAALVGREWDVLTVIEATGSEDRVLDAVDEALAAGLVREASGSGSVYAFAHDIVRHTLEEDISLARRERWHLRIADALERVHGAGSVGAVAMHLRRAGAMADPERTITVSMMAAHRARRSAAFEEAREHAEAAIRLLDDAGGDPAHTARLREMLGDTLYGASIDPERGIEQLEVAREAYDALGDPRSAAKVRSKIAVHLTTYPPTTDIGRAQHELEEALRILEPEGPSVPLVYALTTLAVSAVWGLQTERGLDAATWALEMAEQLGHEPARTGALTFAGYHVLNSGELDRGLRMMEEAHASAVEHGGPLQMWIAGYALATSGNLLQDPSGWYGWMDGELASGRYDEAPGLRDVLRAVLGGWSLCRGRVEEARALFDDIAGNVPSLPPRELFAPDLTGRWEEAATTRLEFTERSLARGNLNNILVELWRVSCLRELQGLHDEAIRLCERASGMLPPDAPTWARLWVDGRLAILLAPHDRPRALACLEACRRILASGEDYRGLAGLVAMAEGANATEPGAADEAFARALEAYRRVDHKLLEAEVLWRWGAATRCPEHLDASIALYEHMGAAEAVTARIRSLVK